MVSTGPDLTVIAGVVASVVEVFSVAAVGIVAEVTLVAEEVGVEVDSVDFVAGASVVFADDDNPVA